MRGAMMMIIKRESQKKMETSASSLSLSPNKQKEANLMTTLKAPFTF